MANMKRRMQRESSRRMDKRIAREVKKAEVTYTFTNAQLAARDRQAIESSVRDIAEKMERRFLKIFFPMAIVICHEQLNWNEAECNWFAEALCDEYKENFYGRCTDERIEEYARRCEEITGISFED